MPERLVNLSRENLRMQRADVVFGDVEYGPGGSCGPRIQHDYQLVIMHEGTLDIEIGDTIFPVGTGQAILLSPGRREHLRFTATARTRHSWCAVPPSSVPKDLQRAMRAAANPLAWTSRLQRLFDLGKECGAFIAEDTVIETQRFQHLALLLMTEFLAEGRRQSTGITDPRIERMQKFIAAEHRRPMGLADLARAAGLSKQYLRRTCLRLGMSSPVAQLYQHRLHRASDLLLHTGLSIKEIADQCGFVNPYHFSRKFKQWSHFSPRAYRQRF